MNASSASLLALMLLLLSAASGCVDTLDPTGLDAAKACPAAALRLTGSTDCSERTRFHQDLLPSAPSGWKCLASGSLGTRSSLTYYHDGADHVGLWFSFDNWHEPVVPMGRAALVSAGRTDVVDFGPAASGFLRFPGTYQNGTIHLETYGFAANGTPTFLSTANLTMMQLDNESGPVYLWRFTGTDGSAYHFFEPTRRPDGPPGFGWGPTNVRLHGSDFDLHMRFQRGIVTTNDFDLRPRDPLAILRPGPGCEGVTGAVAGQAPHAFVT